MIDFGKELEDFKKSIGDEWNNFIYDEKSDSFKPKADKDWSYQVALTRTIAQTAAWHTWKKCAESKQAEIDGLKAKLEAAQATKQTYFLTDADYIVDDPCEYELEPELGEVFEFEKWNRSKEVKVYIVPIFKNEDEYELVEFCSEDEADKAAAENKAMIEAAQGEGHE